MRILFIHQNLPGQFKHLLAAYGSMPDTQVVGLGEMRRLRENIRAPIPGVRFIGYEAPKPVTATSPTTLRTTEAAVQRGQAVLSALLKLKHGGFYPDVVYAHPGWGETLFLKDVYPRARLVHFCEFYYNTEGQDFNFDPEFPNSVEDVLRLRTRNMHHLMALEQADVGIAPTHWQKSRFPTRYHEKIHVVHDGIDTAALCPDHEAFVEFPKKKLRLTRDDEVVTFVSRNLEPYRGFHIFMRALPELLRRRPKVHVIVIGGDDVSYGKRLPQGTYRQRALSEVGHEIDFSRVHFCGKVPYSTFKRVLQVSSAHVYLTYPFVLSWSLLEAMASGCLVIGSKTAPVEEVIEHGKNGLLVDFFSPAQIVDRLDDVLSDRHAFLPIRQLARDTVVRRYGLKESCIDVQMGILGAQVATSAA